LQALKRDFSLSMKEPHYYKLGSLTSPSGALFIINDNEGVILSKAEIYKATLQANGITVTPEIEQQILLLLRKRQAEFDQQVSLLGVPDRLKTLLEFTKKSKAIAYCRRVCISEHDLFLLAHNCSQIEFKHRSKFTEFVPQDRKVLDSDISNMKQGNPRQFINKVDRIIEERKRYHVHLFERDKEWHCFYYTYKDMESGKERHWELGSHLHYVSHLWTNYRKKQVWDSFDQRNVDIQGVHIKLEPFVIDQSFNTQFKSSAVELINKFRQSNS